jgi:hypothetical protein
MDVRRQPRKGGPFMRTLVFVAGDDPFSATAV